MINFRAMGRRIREYRLNRHMTQEALAERLNISIEYMSRIETGNCRASYALIEKMGQIFQVDESEILFGKSGGRAADREMLERIDRLSAEQKDIVQKLIQLFSDQPT
ncbi:MAG: helix-turn-helix transcriptional regulator [Clostridia bacterium]|nr:helix-turn-helix transcriptional regulator [Clostridia bacterium]